MCLVLVLFDGFNYFQLAMRDKSVAAPSATSETRSVGRKKSVLRAAIERVLQEQPEASNEVVLAHLVAQGLEVNTKKGRSSFSSALNLAREGLGIRDFILREDDETVVLLVHLPRDAYETAARRYSKRVGPWLSQLLGQLSGDPDK